MIKDIDERERRHRLPPLDRDYCYCEKGENIREFRLRCVEEYNAWLKIDLRGCRVEFRSDVEKRARKIFSSNTNPEWWALLSYRYRNIKWALKCMVQLRERIQASAKSADYDEVPDAVPTIDYRRKPTLLTAQLMVEAAFRNR